MKKKISQTFKTQFGEIPLPVFFPDATRAVLKTLDTVDIENTKTPGILVNTYHLYQETGGNLFKKTNGIRNFMNWKGGVISDSGGFQVMSVIKSGVVDGKITDDGVVLYSPKRNKKTIFTPEESIKFQFKLQSDMVVVLDDFTDPKDTYEFAKKTVDRTIEWAKRSKEEYLKECERLKLPKNKRPYLLGVVQGGEFLDLREYCTRELVKIGFDGLGYGGWPLDQNGVFNYEIGRVMREFSPDNYLLYGLGVGKPQEIVGLCDMGFTIFDCVLPTRDARHKRLYTFKDFTLQGNFYEYFTPDKEKYYYDQKPVSGKCDCLLCQNYSRAYLAHLFRIGDMTAGRLATIHNLRFYSMLMEKIRTH